MMQRTEQLVKALALDFLRNNRRLFNMGVMQMLCQQQKVHESTTQQQINHKLSLIDKAFYLLKHQPITTTTTKYNPQQHQHLTNLNNRNLHNMLSVLLFNISAINQHHIQQIESHMIESTASMSYDKDTMVMTMQKDKLATNILKQRVQQYFELFTMKSTYLHELIFEQLPQRKQQTHLMRQGELSLLQTVDYLCVKYSINNKISQQIIEILQQYEPHPSQEINASQLHTSQCIKRVNELVFGGQVTTQNNNLFNLLETSSIINYRHLLMLINSNYLQRSNGKRKIFSTAVKDGKQVIEGIMVRVVKRVGKGELFSDKNQDYGPFKVILMHCLTKHFPVYWQFAHIINQLTYVSNSNHHNSSININAIKRIQQFFRVYITVQQPFFQQLIGFMYRVLQSKYNEQTAMELMKKFLLNRFLLNPAFFILFHDPNQEETQKFVEVANIVRSLFYPNKAQQLATTLNNPNIIKLSTDIIHSLQYCLKKQKDPKLLSSFNTNTHPLYINDKIIKSTMVEFFNDLNEHNKLVTLKSRIANVSANNDYSLEFQLVRNQNSSKNIFSKPFIENVSEVRLAGNTNRSNNPKDNQSIRYMYEQLKGERTQREEMHSSKVQEKNHRTKLPHHTQYQPTRPNHHFSPTSKHLIKSQTRLHQQQSNLILTDRQIIQQLVELRKQYGQRKKKITAQYEMRRTKSVRRMSVLQSFSSRFNEFKSEIEKDNDSLYVHMTSIA